MKWPAHWIWTSREGVRWIKPFWWHCCTKGSSTSYLRQLMLSDVWPREETPHWCEKDMTDRDRIDGLLVGDNAASAGRVFLSQTAGPLAAKMFRRWGMFLCMARDTCCKKEGKSEQWMPGAGRTSTARLESSLSTRRQNTARIATRWIHPHRVADISY